MLACTCFGIAAAGDRRAADPRTDSASSPASPPSTGLAGPYQPLGPPWQDGGAAQLSVSV